MSTGRRRDMTREEKLAYDVAVSFSTKFIPRAERIGRISPLREICCRRCGRWMDHSTGEWRHLDDDTIACVDPMTLLTTDTDCDKMNPTGSTDGRMEG